MPADGNARYLDQASYCNKTSPHTEQEQPNHPPDQQEEGRAGDRSQGFKFLIVWPKITQHFVKISFSPQV